MLFLTLHSLIAVSSLLDRSWTPKTIFLSLLNASAYMSKASTLHKLVAADAAETKHFLASALPSATSFRLLCELSNPSAFEENSWFSDAASFEGFSELVKRMSDREITLTP